MKSIKHFTVSILQTLFLISLLFSCKNKTIINPEQGEIIEAVYGLGTVDTEERFLARSAITNYIQEFYVSEGQDVIKGQKLYKTEQGVIMNSPFDGRVTEIPISVKENVFPQTVILTVLNLKKLFLTVSLEQQAAMRIKKNLNVEVSFEFFRNKKLKGKIDSIYPIKDQFIAKVVLENWPEGVLPGMTADVAIEVAKKQNAVLVPANSIINGNILIKRDGKKQKIPVEIGLMDFQKVEILSPTLHATDEIIIP